MLRNMILVILQLRLCQDSNCRRPRTHFTTIQWRHNERDGVSNHHPNHCLLNHLFGRRSKKTSKLRVTGLCAGNSSGTSEFPAQRASYVENVSIWWRHHEHGLTLTHWGRDKMAAISQTTFSNAFSWIKTYEFVWMYEHSLDPFAALVLWYNLLW